jgi:methylated-DNA-[protein]-cysteine S-methyltransferase
MFLGRSAGGPAQLFWTVVDSPIDPLLLIGDGTGLRSLWMSPHEPPADAVRDDDALAPVATQLAEYFAGARTRFEIPLQPQGTPFQQKVWLALRDIPFGVTTTYGTIAVDLGQPTASRAVGLANGRNPLAVIVPCHRVVGANGALTGFGGGLPRKRWLLDHERRVLGATGGGPAGLW